MYSKEPFPFTHVSYTKTLGTVYKQGFLSTKNLCTYSTNNNRLFVRVLCFYIQNIYIKVSQTEKVSLCEIISFLSLISNFLDTTIFQSELCHSLRTKQLAWKWSPKPLFKPIKVYWVTYYVILNHKCIKTFTICVRKQASAVLCKFQFKVCRRHRYKVAF